MSQKTAANAKSGAAAAQGGTWAVLDSDEFEELRKFVGVLAQKAGALIVEARTGQKISSPSNPEPTNADWFGLAVRESPKVRADFKEVVKNHAPVIDKPFGVEIIAHLPTSEEIPLEYWWLWFDTSVRDQDVRVKYAVYNRMAILLKSIIVVLRASPVNNLIRQNDYFEFSYRLFTGKPNLDCLTSIAKNYKVGPLKTPYGSIFFSGACREMAFSDSPVAHPLTEPVSRPLGREGTSPRFGASGDVAIGPSPDKPTSLHLKESPLPENRITVEVCPVKPSSAPVPSPVLHRQRTTFQSLHCTGAFATPSRSLSDSDEDSYEIPEKAFASLIGPEDDDEDDPINTDEDSPKRPPKSILKETQSKPRSEPVGIVNGNKPKPRPFFASRLSLTDDGFEDEDILETEQLRPAFASAKPQTASHDLASFLHECRVAPLNLKSLELKGVSVERTVKSLNQNLGGMEEQLHEFDKFVDDLRIVGDSSWVMTMSGQ